MKKEVIRLCDIPPGKSARIASICECGTIKRRLLDMGFFENAEVKCIGESPLGDPRAYLIRGAVIALRHDVCAKIICNICE